MNFSSLLSASGRGDPRTPATDIYISIMFLVFPLFVGFHGYEKITLSKFLFFSIATGLWLLSLLLLSIKAKPHGFKPRLHHIFALCFMAIVCISAILSPHRGEALLGAGRYDGLVSQLLYLCIFIGVSLYGRIEDRHFAFLGISVGICCIISVFQLFNINIFGLFPADYSYYDKHIIYSGEFLGSMGNTNVLSEFLCLAIPVFFILPVLREERRFLLSLIPLSLCVFVVLRAHVSGGLVALLGCALVGAGIVLADIRRLCRGLCVLAFCCIPAALAFAFCPEYLNRSFSFTFTLNTTAGLCVAGAAALFIFAFLLRRARISDKALRLILIGLAALAVFSGLCFVYFAPPAEGTLYELSQLLHGKVEDSFGSSRILIWRECLQVWQKAPLLGHGPDTVALTVDIDFSRYVEETGKTLRSSVDNSHNVYLGYLVNTGLLGLISYLSILICGLVRWLRNLPRPAVCTLGLALLCCCFQNFFALGLCLSIPLFWICLGLMFSPSGKSEV